MGAYRFIPIIWARAPDARIGFYSQYRARPSVMSYALSLPMLDSSDSESVLYGMLFRRCLQEVCLRSGSSSRCMCRCDCTGLVTPNDNFTHSLAEFRFQRHRTMLHKNSVPREWRLSGEVAVSARWQWRTSYTRSECVPSHTPSITTGTSSRATLETGFLHQTSRCEILHYGASTPRRSQNSCTKSSLCMSLTRSLSIAA